MLPPNVPLPSRCCELGAVAHHLDVTVVDDVEEIARLALAEDGRFKGRFERRAHLVKTLADAARWRDGSPPCSFRARQRVGAAPVAGQRRAQYGAVKPRGGSPCDRHIDRSRPRSPYSPPPRSARPA